MDQVMEALDRDAQVHGQPGLADLKGLHELLKKYLSRMNGGKSFFHFKISSVVIHYFHVVGVRALPGEANPELIVDPDAVLSPPIPFQRLQAVAGREAQILGAGRRVDPDELPSSRGLEGRRETPGHSPTKELFGFLAGE
jgi:hypothetical protein